MFPASSTDVDDIQYVKTNAISSKRVIIRSSQVINEAFAYCNNGGRKKKLTIKILKSNSNCNIEKSDKNEKLFRTRFRLFEYIYFYFI